MALTIFSEFLCLRDLVAIFLCHQNTKTQNPTKQRHI